MSKRKPLTIGEMHFPTQKACKDFYRQILRSYVGGQRVCDSHVDLLMPLLLRHPTAAEKIGAGISHFTVETTDFNDIGFHLHRVDGTSDNFSFYKCIDGQTNPLTTFAGTCRTAVKEQTIGYRTQYFNGRLQAPCELTGEMLWLDDAHVDHIDPLFRDIVDAFIEQEGIDVDNVEYETEGLYGRKFKDPLLQHKFGGFHLGVAKLRVIHRRENLRRPKTIRWAC